MGQRSVGRRNIKQAFPRCRFDSFASLESTASSVSTSSNFGNTRVTSSGNALPCMDTRVSNQRAQKGPKRNEKDRRICKSAMYLHVLHTHFAYELPKGWFVYRLPSSGNRLQGTSDWREQFVVYITFRVFVHKFDLCRQRS